MNVTPGEPHPNQMGALWAQSLRLLVSTVSDAERIAGLTGAVGLPSLRDMLARLTTQDRAENVALVGVLLEVSPSEALRLSAAIGIDAFDTNRAELITALQRPELVMHAVNEVVAGTLEGGI